MRIRKRPQSCSAPPLPPPPPPLPDLCPSSPFQYPRATPTAPEGAAAPKGVAVLHPQPTSGRAKKEEVEEEARPSLVQVLRGKQESVVVGAHKTWNIGGVHSSSTAGSSSGVKIELKIGEENGVEEENKSGANRKRRRKPAVLMEGSRCSRVNGRGWRCCQQTLVGYSLCEHHLGKGRMRSMSSVRCNGANRKKSGASSMPQQSQNGDDEDDNNGGCDGDGNYDDDVKDDDEFTGLKSRKKKIGMVKARSISSLLHETDQGCPVTAAEDAVEATALACRAEAHREGIGAMV